MWTAHSTRTAAPFRSSRRCWMVLLQKDKKWAPSLGLEKTSTFFHTGCCCVPSQTTIGRRRRRPKEWLFSRHTTDNASTTRIIPLLRLWRGGYFSAKDPTATAAAAASEATAKRIPPPPNQQQSRLLEIVEQQRNRLAQRHSQLSPKQATLELNKILQLWLDALREFDDNNVTLAAAAPSPRSSFAQPKNGVVQPSSSATTTTNAAPTATPQLPSASELWHWMMDTNSITSGLKTSVHPSLLSYQMLIDGIQVAAANKKNKRTTEQHRNNLALAESLLHLMMDLWVQEEESDHGAYISTPPTLAAQIARAEYNQTPPTEPHNKKNTMPWRGQLVQFATHKVMTMYAQSDDVVSAERLLRRLEQLYDDNDDNNSNDASSSSSTLLRYLLSLESYTIVVSGWAHQRKSPQEAEYVINRMLNRAARCKTKRDDTGKNNPIWPSKDNFESCLTAWAKYASKPEAGQRAELLLLKMQEMYENSHHRSNTKPCLKSFSKVVAAWGSSRHGDAPARADAIIQMMEEMDWSLDKADAESFCQKMTETYLVGMKLWSWSNKQDAPEKCAALLERLGRIVGHDNIKPTKLERLYAVLIDTWAKSGRPNAQLKAEGLLNEWKRQDKVPVFPTDQRQIWDSPLHRSILNLYAKTGDGEKAEAVLNTMLQGILNECSESLDPKTLDVQPFNSTLLAWSRSTDPKATDRAEALFLHIVKLQPTTRTSSCSTSGPVLVVVQPDVVTYNAVLAAMAGTREEAVALRGMGYFRQLQEQRDPRCQPTAITYTKAMQLWPKVRTPVALQQVQGLLNEMSSSVSSGDCRRRREGGVRPDAEAWMAYISVLSVSKLAEPDLSQHLKLARSELEKLGNGHWKFKSSE